MPQFQKGFFLLFLLFFNCIEAQSQQTKIDSLTAVLAKYKAKDTVRVNKLFDLMQELQSSEAVRTSALIAEAAQLSNKLDFE